MRSEESLVELCLWILRDENGVIQALCDSVRTDNVAWESRVFTLCGARITQACDKHTNTRSGFEIAFTEHVKAISLLSLPSTSTSIQKVPNDTT